MKALVRVPETELAVMTIPWAAPVPWPTDMWHAKDVFEAQVAVQHAWEIMPEDGVASVMRKFKPVTVTMPPADTPMLPLATKLTTGAAMSMANPVTRTLKISTSVTNEQKFGKVKNSRS